MSSENHKPCSSFFSNNAQNESKVTRTQENGNIEMKYKKNKRLYQIKRTIKKISSCTESIISADYVVYLQENNYEIGTTEDPKTLDEAILFHNLLTAQKLRKMSLNQNRNLEFGNQLGFLNY